MRLSDEDLRGRTVISKDGLAIGEITRFYLDATEWRVDSIVVRLRKDVAERLGTKGSLFHAATTEIPAHLIQSVGDAVILGVPIEGLRQPPLAQPSESAPLH